MPVKSNHKWLVIILIYNHQYYDEMHTGETGYVSMESQKNHIFHQIKDIKFPPEMDVILIENRLSFVKGPHNEVLLREVVDLVEKDDVLRTRSINDASHPDVLTEEKNATSYLKEITDQYPTHKKMFITFGHGSIFGINFMVAPDALQPKKSATNPKPGHIKPVNKQELWRHDYTLENISFDNLIEVQNFIRSGPPVRDIKITQLPILSAINAANRSVILTNMELSNVITNTVGKANIVVMYNCLMQNLYTQYDLCKIVDCLVAPVSGICHPGYNYTGLFALMIANLNKDDKDIADLFVDTIREPTKYYEQYEADIEGSWKICSVTLDCSKFEIIKTKFTDVITEINNLANQSKKVFICISQTLDQCYNYAAVCLNNNQSMIDLFTFSNYLCEIIQRDFTSFDQLLVRTTALVDALAEIESKSFIGHQFFPSAVNFKDKDYITNYGFGFLLQTKMFPADTIQQETLSSEQSEYYPEFLKGTGFYKFYLDYTNFYKR